MSVLQIGCVIRLRSQLSAGEYQLLLLFADYADKHGGHIFPSDARLLEQTGWTPRYLRLVKRKLLMRGLITRVREGGGRRKRTIYALVLTAANQLLLPFEPQPVKKLLKPCGSVADEETETVIKRSALGDLLIRPGGASRAVTARQQAASGGTRRADPSWIRPVLPVRTKKSGAARAALSRTKGRRTR